MNIKLNQLMVDYYKTPTDAIMAQMLTICQPLVETKINSLYGDFDRDDLYSTLSVAVWELLKKYPLREEWDGDTYNIEGLILRHLSYRASNFLTAQDTKLNGSRVNLKDAEDINQFADKVDVGKLFEDTDLVQKIYENSSQDLKDVIDLMLGGASIRQTSEQLGISRNSVNSSLLQLRRLAYQLLDEPNPEDFITELVCITCGETLGVENFSKDSSMKTGRNIHCRACQKLHYKSVKQIKK